MADAALTPEQQMQLDNANLKAEQVIYKMDNAELRKRNEDNQIKIQEYHKAEVAHKEMFDTYKKQTKEDKEKSDKEKVGLETQVRQLE